MISNLTKISKPRLLQSTKLQYQQAVKPTKHDMKWYFKNASGAAVMGMTASIFIMTIVSGTLAYFGVANYLIPWIENYNGSNPVLNYFKNHLQPTREFAKKMISRLGMDFSQEFIDFVISTGLIYLILKPIKVTLFFKLTHSLAKRRIRTNKCIDTYDAHKAYGKQKVREKYVLFTDKYAIRKRSKKETSGSAYNHYKLRQRRLKSGLIDKKDLVKEKLMDKKQKITGKMFDKQDQLKDKIEDLKDKI